MKTTLTENVLEACGASDIQHYLDIIDRLEEGFKESIDQEQGRIYSSKKIALGEKLFDYLWKLKPKRFLKDNYLLSHALKEYHSDDPDASCGNCLALTALYNILAEKLDIPVSVLDPGNHVLSRIEADDMSVNVDNSIIRGFGLERIQLFENHPWIDLDELPTLPNKHLVATTYFNSAEIAYCRGDIEYAWELLDKAMNASYHSSFTALESALRRLSDY